MNGAPDDTSYLNDLLRRGGTIHLDGKIYHISADLTISMDGTKVIGCGGTVIQKTQTCQILISSNSCLVERVTVDGNQQGGSGFFVTGSFNAVVRCGSANNGGHGFAFDGGHLRPGDDLSTNNCRFNEISSCSATRNGGIGISQYHHWDARVINNVCLENALEGITNDVWSLRNLVAGNSLQHNCQNGGVGAIGADYSDLNRILHNFIEQKSDFPGITLQNNIGQSNYNIISQNIIVNPSHGILLRANREGPPDPRDEVLQPAPRTSNNNVVIDNIIRGALQFDDFGVLQESGCLGNDIRGNKLSL